MTQDAYRGWSISYDPPPIPYRGADWTAVHPDYDAWTEDGSWTDNGMKVSAASREALIIEIDDWLEDQE